MAEIIHAYHGSENTFRDFNFENIGSNGGTTGCGSGLYFSTSKSESLQYGPIIYTVNLQLHNSISNNSVTLTDNIVNLIIDDLPIESIDILQYGSDVEIINDLLNLGVATCQVLFDKLVSLGYSHAVDFTSPDDNSMPHYIVYDLEAITILDTEIW